MYKTAYLENNWKQFKSLRC